MSSLINLASKCMTVALSLPLVANNISCSISNLCLLCKVASTKSSPSGSLACHAASSSFKVDARLTSSAVAVCKLQTSSLGFNSYAQKKYHKHIAGHAAVQMSTEPRVSVSTCRTCTGSEWHDFAASLKRVWYESFIGSTINTSVYV